jgi:hypothetical protein
MLIVVQEETYIRSYVCQDLTETEDHIFHMDEQPLNNSFLSSSLQFTRGLFHLYIGN